jgi:hydrogenase maturation protease
VTGPLVIGIGNPDCGDDAVGLLVAQRLVRRFPPEVTILKRPGNMIALLDEGAGHDPVVLIDAAALRTTPGVIHRIDLLREPLPAELSLASTHAFGVADAVELARALGRLPERLVVYAVEGCRFEPGAAMSRKVAAAADRVVAEVLAFVSEAMV